MPIGEASAARAGLEAISVRKLTGEESLLAACLLAGRAGRPPLPLVNREVFFYYSSKRQALD